MIDKYPDCKKYSAKQLNNLVDKWDAMMLSYERVNRNNFSSSQDYIQVLSNKLDNAMVELLKATDIIDDLTTGNYIRNKYFSKQKEEAYDEK